MSINLQEENSIKKNNIYKIRYNSKEKSNNNSKYNNNNIQKNLTYEKIQFLLNNNNIINKNLKKYNCSIRIKNIMIINDIISSKLTHFTATFKDYLIYDYKQEFFKRYYNYYEITDKIPKFYKYYKNYLTFFCRPIFNDFYENSIIQKYGENQAEIYYNKKYGKDKKNNKKNEEKNNNKQNNKKEKNIKTIIFSESIIKIIENFNNNNKEDYIKDKNESNYIQNNNSKNNNTLNKSDSIKFSSIKDISRDNSSFSILNLFNEKEKEKNNEIKTIDKKILNSINLENNINNKKRITIRNNLNLIQINSKNNSNLHNINFFIKSNDNRIKNEKIQSINSVNTKKFSSIIDTNIKNYKADNYSLTPSKCNIHFYLKTKNNFYSKNNIIKTENISPRIIMKNNFYNKNINKYNKISMPMLQITNLSKDLKDYNNKDNLLYINKKKNKVHNVLSLKNNSKFKPNSLIKKIKLNLNKNDYILFSERKRKINPKKILNTYYNFYTDSNKQRNSINFNNININNYILINETVPSFSEKNNKTKKKIKNNTIQNDIKNNININKQFIEGKLNKRAINFLSTIHKSRNNQNDFYNNSKLINNETNNYYIVKSLEEYKNINNNNFMFKTTKDKIFETTNSKENIRDYSQKRINDLKNYNIKYLNNPINNFNSLKSKKRIENYKSKIKLFNNKNIITNYKGYLGKNIKNEKLYLNDNIK